MTYGILMSVVPTNPMLDQEENEQRTLILKAAGDVGFGGPIIQMSEIQSTGVEDNPTCQCHVRILARV